MQAHALTVVSIVRLETDVMAAVIERIRDSCGKVSTQLHKVILDIRLQTDVMHIAAPIETGLRANLMLADCSRFSEEIIARLELVLHLLLGRGAESEEGLHCPKRSLILCFKRMGLRIRYFILLPHTPCLRIIVEMAVLMIEDISAVQSEIEFARAERMPEIESGFRLTQRCESPFRLMMSIDIKDGALAVVQVIPEIKQGIRVTNRAADITVVVLAGFEARRLRKQGMEGSGRHDIRRKGGVLYRRRFNGRLHYRRFGSHFTRRLYHRLKIALDSDAAVEGRIRLGEGGSN